eukprot:s926_g3.t4
MGVCVVEKRWREPPHKGIEMSKKTHGSSHNGAIDVIQVMQETVFCPMGPGDVPHRHKFYQAFLAGCIPVVFDFPSYMHGQRSWWMEDGSPFQLSVPFPEDIPYEDIVVIIPCTENYTQSAINLLLKLRSMSAEDVARRQSLLQDYRHFLSFQWDGSRPDAFTVELPSCSESVASSAGGRSCAERHRRTLLNSPGLEAHVDSEEAVGGGPPWTTPPFRREASGGKISEVRRWVVLTRRSGRRTASNTRMSCAEHCHKLSQGYTVPCVRFLALVSKLTAGGFRRFLPEPGHGLRAAAWEDRLRLISGRRPRPPNFPPDPMHVLHAPPYGVQLASSMQAWNFRTERWFSEVAEMPAGTHLRAVA